MEKLRILILSSNKAELINTTRALCSNIDYHVLATLNPGRAKHILGSNPVHLIIVDQKLSGVSGFDFLKQLSVSSPKTIRVIVDYPPGVLGLNGIGYDDVFHFFIAKPLIDEVTQMVVKQALELFNIKRENGKLIKALQKKNDLLANWQDELKNFEDQKKRFIMLANHELRTPATVISSSLDLLSNDMKNLDESRKKLFLYACSGSKRLNTLLEQFSFYLRSEKLPVKEKLHVINLSDLVHKIKLRILDDISERNLFIQFEIKEELLIKGDENLISQLFNQLISNAVKHTPDGGQITIKAVNGGPFVMITVKDNGIGINNSEMKNIFNTFYKSGNILHHHSSKYEYLGGGAGLGLALCKKIVKAHSGEIFVKSKGKQSGACFTVKLPLLNNHINYPLNETYRPAASLCA